jgi:hypothetical protein
MPEIACLPPAVLAASLLLPVDIWIVPVASKLMTSPARTSVPVSNQHCVGGTTTSISVRTARADWTKSGVSRGEPVAPHRRSSRALETTPRFRAIHAG